MTSPGPRPHSSNGGYSILMSPLGLLGGYDLIILQLASTLKLVFEQKIPNRRSIMNIAFCEANNLVQHQPDFELLVSTV